MSERIHELLHRNLQEVFGEWEPARRRAAIQELYTDDCVLYVLPGVFVGHDALDKFAGDLRATHPHFVYTPHAEPQALHNAGRLAWGSGPRGEKPNYTGLDVIIVREARISVLYVVLDGEMIIKSDGASIKSPGYFNSDDEFRIVFLDLERLHLEFVFLNRFAN